MVDSMDSQVHWPFVSLELLHDNLLFHRHVPVMSEETKLPPVTCSKRNWYHPVDCLHDFLSPHAERRLFWSDRKQYVMFNSRFFHSSWIRSPLLQRLLMPLLLPHNLSELRPRSFYRKDWTFLPRICTRISFCIWHNLCVSGSLQWQWISKLLLAIWCG